MARSYVGYKDHIEELENDANDKLLLKTHMSNLLAAVKINSSNFLSNEGDKHPFLDKFLNKKSTRKVDSESDDAN